MADVELTDALLAKLAGWEAVKAARAMLAAGRVIESEWQPPRLTGKVREASGAMSTGLIIRSASDAENLCPCRDSRQRGLICAHAVAVGLHQIQPKQPVSASIEAKASQAPIQKTSAKSLRRAEAGSEGEPLELFFILPPNASEAIGKSRVMIYLEGQSRKGRSPLNVLPLDVPFALSEQDAAALDFLESLNDADTPAMVMLNANQFSELLARLTGHPRVSFGRNDGAQILDEPLKLALSVSLEKNGEIVLRLRDAAPSGVIPGATAWVLQGKTFRPLGLPLAFGQVFSGPMRITRANVPQFLNTDWPALVNACDVQANFSLDDFEIETANPRFKLRLEGGLAILQAKLECFYGDKCVVPGAASQNDSFWLPDPASPTRYRTRNFDLEQAAIARLGKRGFTGPDSNGVRHLKGQNEVLNFFAREFPRIEKEWDVTLEERLERSTKQNIERIEPKFQITPSGEQWFNLDVSYDTRDGEKFSNADIQGLLRSGQSHSRLKNGKFVLLDTGAVEELQEVLLDCAPAQHAGGYRLDNAQAGFVDATLRAQAGWQIRAPEAWTRRAAQQSGEVKLSPPELGALESVLRPYQKEGVAWLAFLRANGFGGILADEMGLGKTLQVLALLQSFAGRNNGASPSLVVCPTSLAFNWAAEAARFTPGLRVLTLHGPQRHENFAKISESELVITSYALLRRDAASYRDLEFDTVVLDEAQHIKNRQTQNAQAVKAIRSRHRLVLTGTPIENSVLDLWSIFDFLMPGYLGNAQDFRERYELPIVRDKDRAAQDRLARRLRPFLLRRLKREVARDLPEKIEQVSFCDLNEEQRALYQQVLDASRREILEAVDANGLAKSRMVVLTALLRLRQICCDMRLLKLHNPQAPGDTTPSSPSPQPSPLGRGRAASSAGSNLEPLMVEHSVDRSPSPRGEGPGEGERSVIRHGVSGANPSGKLELFSELLEEVLDGGHRVLVFSQFTSMLGFLREQLEGQGIEFCYLDGATRDRANVVEKFQRDARIPVFLISLKAGGVGLNLTGADTVIHFDPWWNPAVEAQATDRAHRIGQKRVVTSYKLITRGTVEEKILNLQTRKRALVQNLLGGEEELTNALDWGEIQELLAS